MEGGAGGRVPVSRSRDAMRFWKHAVLAAILSGAILLTGCEKIVGKLPPAPPGPPPGGLPTGVLNRGYNFVLKVSSSGPPNFVVSGGLLPSGISLAIDGTFFGTPVEIGIFNFTVDISDKNGTTSAGMTLEITPELAAYAVVSSP